MVDELQFAVHIETTNHCNAKCSFCPHSDMKRPKGFMTDAMYDKALEQAKELNPVWIFPFLSGEPFMDKKIYDRVARIREVFGDINIGIYTNLGIPLKEEQIEVLRGVEVVVSYAEGISEITREKNIALLVNHKMSTRIHVVAESTTNTFVEPRVWEAAKLSTKYKIPYQEFQKYNWAGKIPSKMPFIDGRCFRPQFQACVLWDGRVGLCCMDIDGEVILGDLDENTLKEIWEGPIATKYRTSKKSELEFCKRCNMPVV